MNITIKSINSTCRSSSSFKTASKLFRARTLYAEYGFRIAESQEQFLSNQMLVTERWVKEVPAE